MELRKIWNLLSKKNRLYISECSTKIKDLKKHIKSDAWKKDKDTCVHELVKVE